LILANGNTNATGSSTGTLSISGGAVTLATTGATAVTLANAAAGTATGSIALTGGSLTVQGAIISGTGAGTRVASVTLNGSVLDMTGNAIGTSAAPITFNAQSGRLSGLGELNGGAPLIKTTTGGLELLNGNTYTGGTQVNAGTLLVNNTLGSGTGSGNVTVGASGALSGAGIIASNNAAASVSIQGMLNVGNASDTSGSAFTLNLSGGSSVFTLGGTVQLDLWSGLGAGGGTGVAFSDLLAVNANTIDLTGSTLKLNNSSGFANNLFAVGDSWQLFDWNSVAFTGTFSNITSGLGNFQDLPDLDAYGLAWDTSALYTTGHIVVGVPEPSRALLLLLGLLSVGFRRRRN
jgi:autotransporter-associated beta strand protein